MDDMPCKGCLIFPICKSQAIEHIKANVYKCTVDDLLEFDITYHTHQIDNPLSIAYYVYNEVLKPKCDIIFNWVGEYSKSKEDRFNCMVEIHKLFV